MCGALDVLAFAVEEAIFDPVHGHGNVAALIAPCIEFVTPADDEALALLFILFERELNRRTFAECCCLPNLDSLGFHGANHSTDDFVS